jgi:hypothetical protein
MLARRRSESSVDSAALRAAAERLVEQAILRREMAFSEFTPPPQAAAESLLSDLKRTRFRASEAAYRAALTAYAVTEEELLGQLHWHLTLLRFIDVRFRPGIQVSAADVRDYYDLRFLPEWRQSTAAPPPPAGQVRERIEAVLAQEQLDAVVGRFLNQARTQLTIRFRDEAFRP